MSGRCRRWYRLTVDGVERQRPVSSAWLQVTIDDLKRRGRSGVARRCKAPQRPVERVHLGGLGEGRCGDRALSLRTTGDLDAVTCPHCVRDRVASEWLVRLRGFSVRGYVA